MKQLFFAAAVLAIANGSGPRAEAAAPLVPAHEISAPYMNGLQVRQSWESFVSGPGGAQRLASLKKAYTKMKSLNSAPKTSADYRRSWEYWANIHGYYGAQSPDGTVAQQTQWLQQNGMGQYVSYYTGIVDQMPPDAIAQLVWATCEHSYTGHQANFFAWHRMYLYYFERVVRWAANDNTLRLPYWDYTNPSHVALPAEFRATSSVLYDAKRDPGMNSGASTLDPAQTNINTALQNANYFTYELGIEQGIHGYVHCTVGPNCPVAHMGDVPVAGNDPVFFSHHDNIDRLWACWQHLHPTPGGSWQSQTFSFVDETGAKVTRPVSAFVTESTLGYVYENETNCARGRLILKNPRLILGAAATSSVLTASKNVRVAAPVTTVKLPGPPREMLSRIRDLTTAQTVQLTVRNVTADSPPGTLLAVYLQKNDGSARQYVGTISWFAAFRHHGENMPSDRTYTYDATAALAALGGSAAAANGVSVVFVATTGRVPAGGGALVASPPAAKAFRPEANVRIGSVELNAGAPR